MINEPNRAELDIDDDDELRRTGNIKLYVAKHMLTMLKKQVSQQKRCKHKPEPPSDEMDY